MNRPGLGKCHNLLCFSSLITNVLDKLYASYLTGLVWGLSKLIMLILAINISYYYQHCMTKMKLREVIWLPQDHTAIRNRIRVQPALLALMAGCSTWWRRIFGGGGGRLARGGECQQEMGHSRLFTRGLLKLPHHLSKGYSSVTVQQIPSEGSLCGVK